MKRTEREIMNEFVSLCYALSPENLHCDGEITPAQAQMKAIKIKTRWRQLEQELGRKVSEPDAYRYEFQNLKK